MNSKLINYIDFNALTCFLFFSTESPEPEPLRLHVSGTTVNLTQLFLLTAVMDDEAASPGPLVVNFWL